MEAGTLIEQKTTDENGQILFKADLPVDGTYIVKEIYAPDGFVTSNEEKNSLLSMENQKKLRFPMSLFLKMSRQR